MRKMLKFVATHCEVFLMKNNNIVRWLAQTHLHMKIYDLASEFLSLGIY